MTIYQQIAQDIKKAIDSREMKAGDKIPSVSELRKHYQVSHITVLRAYTELTEQKYIQMKKGQGYFVRNMQQPRNMTLEHGVIGCFLRPLRPETETDNFFNRINLGVQLECASRRIHWLNLHSLSVLNQWPATENAVQQIEPEMIAFAGQVDGLLIDERIPDAMIENLRKLTSKPMLLVNRRTALPIDSVGPPNRQNMWNGMDLTVRMGYDTFLYLCSGNSLYNCIELQRSFLEYLESHPACKERTSFIQDCCIVSWEETARKMDAALDRIVPDARRVLVIAEAGSSCECAAHHLKKRGFELGKKIGLLSALDFGYHRTLSPQPAALRSNPEAIGRLAVEKLLTRIAYASLPPGHFMPEPDMSLHETL